MTNEQLYLAIMIPMLSNAVVMLLGIVFLEVRSNATERRSHEACNRKPYLAIGIPMLLNATLIGLVVALFKTRFDGIDKRFDDMRDLWRAELRRVEEVLDARLKHIEERG